jgi:hypothetical protein
MFRTVGLSTTTVPFSFSLTPSLYFLSRFCSGQVSVSLYYCNHVCEDLCWVSPCAPRDCLSLFVPRASPPRRGGESASADSDSCTLYVSNLSWNTNDDTLRQVRLMFWLFRTFLIVPDDSVFFFFGYSFFGVHTKKNRPLDRLATLSTYALQTYINSNLFFLLSPSCATNSRS